MRAKVSGTPYMLLGDDIVITDKGVADHYLKIMDDLKVDISSQKTHVSPNMFEFAKRWVRNGIEITGVPINGFLQAKDR